MTLVNCLFLSGYFSHGDLLLHQVRQKVGRKNGRGRPQKPNHGSTALFGVGSRVRTRRRQGRLCRVCLALGSAVRTQPVEPRHLEMQGVGGEVGIAHGHLDIAVAEDLREQHQLAAVL